MTRFIEKSQPEEKDIPCAVCGKVATTFEKRVNCQNHITIIHLCGEKECKNLSKVLFPEGITGPDELGYY